MTVLTVESAGPLATIQDLGRPGHAHIGVPCSGAADRGALRLANRLVGNAESAAGVEVTVGGFAARVDGPALIAVTGARVAVRVNGVPVGSHAAVAISSGSTVSIDPASSIGLPPWGLRSYLAVRGGVDGEPVLGSRSTDILSGLGPAVLRPGDKLPVGAADGPWPTVTSAPVDNAHPKVAELSAFDGPRRDHLAAPDDLFVAEWEVGADSNRVGVRLDRTAGSGPLVVHKPGIGELLSEGIAHGSVQVPPSGRPVIFLADHPVTGGYPVVAVLDVESADRAAQLTPGSRVRFRRL